MDRYERLKAKWMETAEGEWPAAVFDTDLLSAGKFLMYISDDDPNGGSECAAYFDTIHDGLAFLRFIQIPVTLDHDSKVDSYEVRPAESFLDKYSGARRNELEALLAELDTLLKSDGITPGALDRVIEQYNASLGNLKRFPSHIHAWGNMAQVMASPHVWDLAAEQMEDVDRDFEFVDALKELLDSGKFNEKYDRHVRMAREFFELVMVV